MIYVLATLAIVSIVMLIISFFVNNRLKEVEDQYEQLTMTMMQNNYQMKQKMKVLEEELLSEDLTEEILKQPYSEAFTKKQLPLVDVVQSMHERGYKAHYIAKETNLSEHDVQSLLHQWNKEGGLR